MTMTTAAGLAAASGGGFVSLSTAAQVLIAALPLVAVIVLGVLSYFFILWDYKKTRLIIERNGTPRPRDIDDKLLLLGVVALFVGLGLLLFFALYSGVSNSLLGGIIPTMTGLGIIIHYMLVRRLRKNRDCDRS
jgi:hypothetical protein